MAVSVLPDWSLYPVYLQITRDLIAEIPDDQLYWAMLGLIECRLGEGGEKLPQVLADLPAGYEVVYHLSQLNGEVGNGGFNQCFWNGTDWTSRQQLVALRRIGATRHVRVFRKAFRIRNRERHNRELQRLYAERTPEAFSASYRVTKLGSCDDQRYALGGEYDALLVRLIRRHPELFVTE